MQLVWHGVNDEVNLRHFMSSRVRWGECDLRRDPRGPLILRHDSFEVRPWIRDEPALVLGRVVEALAEHGRRLKLDLKDGPSILDDVVALLDQHGLGDDDLWFNAGIDALGADGFRTLRSNSRVRSCSARSISSRRGFWPSHGRPGPSCGGWPVGGSRASRSRGAGSTPRPLLERLEDWGHGVNLYAVPDLDSFLEAVLLLPDSLSADFNFPDWNYYGRGSGERRRYHRYWVHEVAASEPDGVATRTGEESPGHHPAAR